MRISDWSSDVCSSDLVAGDIFRPELGDGPRHQARAGRYHPRHPERGRGSAQEPGRGGHRLYRRRGGAGRYPVRQDHRSEEHTSELQSLMRISYAVFCLKKKKKIVRTRKNYIQNYNTYKYKQYYRLYT